MILYWFNIIKPGTTLIRIMRIIYLFYHILIGT